MCDVPGFEEVACVPTPPPSPQGKSEKGPLLRCMCEAQSLNEQIEATVLFLRVCLYSSYYKMPNLFHLALIFKVRNKTPTLLLNVTKNKKINSHPSANMAK